MPVRSFWGLGRGNGWSMDCKVAYFVNLTRSVVLYGRIWMVRTVVAKLHSATVIGTNHCLWVPACVSPRRLRLLRLCIDPWILALGVFGLLILSALLLLSGLVWDALSAFTVTMPQTPHRTREIRNSSGNAFILALSLACCASAAHL